MGMYHYYSLTIPQIAEEEAHRIIAELRADYWEAEEALTETGATLESAKWYDSDEELREFSTRYPEHVFELTMTPDPDDEELGSCTIAFKNGVILEEG